MHGILRMVATLLLLTLPLTMAAALPEAQAMPFAAAPARHLRDVTAMGLRLQFRHPRATSAA